MNAPRCYLCAHGGEARGGLFCPSCARAALYNLRIQQASLLLNKQDLAGRVSQVVSEDHIAALPTAASSSEALAERTRYIISAEHHKRSDELDESRRRVATIAEHAIRLREDMEQYRRKINTEKAQIEQRRTRLDAARARMDSLKRDADGRRPQVSAQSVQALHKSLISWRSQHLQTLAFWARLERERRPWSGRGNDSRSFEYRIGGLVIPDLRNLNHLKEGDEQRLTAALAHICRLLHLVSRYLQVRLPAEVVVPHRDWPLPMILSPLSSYSGQRLAFPHKTLTSPHSSGTGRGDEDQYRTAPRPRPLFLLRPLHQMAGEDAAGYARFVEAVAILGWNVAWLCRVQGLSVAESDWTDACDIGRNLWRLLVESTERTPASGWNSTPGRDGAAGDDKTRQEAAALGVYSHGTAYNYLRAGSNLGAQPSIMDVSVRGWMLGNPVKMISELRTSLLGELAIMEAVIVGEDGEDLGTGENGIQNWEGSTARGGKEGGDVVQAPDVDKAKGRSGWMKLRTRQAGPDA